MATNTTILGGYGDAAPAIKQLVDTINSGAAVSVAYLLTRVYEVFEACSVPEQTFSWCPIDGGKWELPKGTQMSAEERQRYWETSGDWTPSNGGIHPTWQTIQIPCYFGTQNIQGMNMQKLVEWLQDRLVRDGNSPDFTESKPFGHQQLSDQYRSIEGLRVTKTRWFKRKKGGSGNAGDCIGRTQAAFTPTGGAAPTQVSATEAF